MRRIGSVCLIGALALTACGSDGELGDDGVSVANAWSRVTAPGQPAGAVYFDLTVDVDDRLLAASVPASVAGRAEIHKVVVDDLAEMSGVDDDAGSGSSDEMDMSEGSHDMADGEQGAMRMQELADGLGLTAGETVSFEPGSYHVMMPDLVEPLEVGNEFDLTLDFEVAADVTVTVRVVEVAP